ncbi:MAG: hypothetical protein EXS13_02575 [Planctomycetes bacterium]|nr:hypothetical protein [Planctomycetota bacterium]
MQWVVDGALQSGRMIGPQSLAAAPGGPLRVDAMPASTNRRALRRLALPAFANAHAHLDLSGVAGETLPHATFADWVAAVVASRRAQSTPASLASAIREGAAALLASGCSAIGDIDSLGSAWSVLSEFPFEGVSYREWLGSPAPGALDSLEQLLEREVAQAGRLRRGISPHAPYSTAPEVYRAAFRCAARLGTPIASHIAESQEEMELLCHRRGGLQQLFERWRVESPRWTGVESGALAAIARLQPPAGFVVIHGNGLSDRELEQCALNRWPLVHCPRSWRYFGHPPAPLRTALRLGVVLALGTDSRASNEGLDLWDELAAWRGADDELADDVLFAAATQGGRTALGLARAELEAGDRATFQLVERRDGGAQEPRTLLAAAVRGELRTVALVIEGVLAWSIDGRE